jgi:hypothetical protein
MAPDDRYETGRTASSADALPESWVDTPRDPRYPDGDVGVCRNGQGTMLYDRTDPGTYVLGNGVDLETTT